ncbi:hypothetical protein LMG28727_07317 [Paraburkholderia kirstenboschensis]|uniref:4Fe4S-binding leucine-rich repeat protein n=1 Tax=Paraburkholderia kirstenboschensis TaxID=1245436 RepID=UPI000AF87416|nr:4Fe4S-binding leucine-rich repeat protein [Paraburkholderia kirstenboschensis]CAD6561028.1 hypothetical protein LMG28727_07317 [Paraburkholderia kirstenboschensis]
MSAQNVRVPGGDIAPRHWQGGSLDCAGCGYVRFRELPAQHDCGPDHECTQDGYARRIERFFRSHPEVTNEQLAHPCFEVRAVVASHADVFCLPPLLGDQDEVGQLELALRLPQAQPGATDPRCASRGLASGPDWRVRWQLARRAAGEIVASLADDADEEVRALVRQRRQSGEVANLMTTGQTQRSAGVKHG